MPTFAFQTLPIQGHREFRFCEDWTTWTVASRRRTNTQSTIDIIYRRLDDGEDSASNDRNELSPLRLGGTIIVRIHWHNWKRSMATVGRCACLDSVSFVIIDAVNLNSNYVKKINVPKFGIGVSRTITPRAKRHKHCSVLYAHYGTLPRKISSICTTPFLFVSAPALPGFHHQSIARYSRAFDQPRQPFAIYYKCGGLVVRIVM